MASERSQVLSSLGLPQLDCFIERGRHKVEAIRAEGHLNYQRLVASQAHQRLFRFLRLPHVQREIVGATNKNLTMSITSLIIALLGIALHEFQITTEFLLVLVPASRTQDIICAQSKTIYPMSMPLQLMD